MNGLDYPSLIAELTERTGEPVAARSALYVSLAETALSKMLRVGASERVLTITTDSAGNADLPAGFGRFGKLVLNGQLVPVISEQASPYEMGYSIRGNVLYTTYPDTDFQLYYFEDIPSLVTFGSNWLIEAEPEIYLYAVMRQVYLAALKIENAAAAEAILAGLVDQYLRKDAMIRLGPAKYRIEGIVP